MQFNTHVEDAIVQAQLQGDLTFRDTQPCRQLMDTFERSGRGRWRLDLSRLGFIDAVGLGFLLRLFDMAAALGGRLTVTGAAGQVRSLLTATGIDQVLTIA